MEYLLGAFLGVPFLYWNYKILQTDIKEKRIPNRYLLFLLCIIPFWYVYGWYFGYFVDIQIFDFLYRMPLIIGAGFLLYYFNIWGAGDAKYFTVLCLFIPYISPFSMVEATIIVTLITIIISIIVTLPLHIRKSIRSKTLSYKKYILQKISSNVDLYTSENGEVIYKLLIRGVLRKICIFLILFVSLRFIRIFFVAYLYSRGYVENILPIILSINIVFIIGLGFIVFLGIRKGVLIVRKYIETNISKKKRSIGEVIYYIVGVLLLSILLWKDFHYTIDIIFKIMTIYLAIYLLIKICIYFGKYVVTNMETYEQNLESLKKGDKINLTSLENKIPEITKKNIIERNGILKDKQKLLHFLRKHDIYTVQIFKTYSYGVAICLGFIISLAGYDFSEIFFQFVIKNYFNAL